MASYTVEYPNRNLVMPIPSLTLSPGGGGHNEVPFAQALLWHGASRLMTEAGRGGYEWPGCVACGTLLGNWALHCRLRECLARRWPCWESSRCAKEGTLIGVTTVGTGAGMWSVGIYLGTGGRHRYLGTGVRLFGGDMGGRGL